jgi:hypothetical protein
LGASSAVSVYVAASLREFDVPSVRNTMASLALWTTNGEPLELKE